ncbi:hypothetical protein IFM89_012323 [Coptis chinensis]|uniref:Uncharacterized protein n=1 Tax=Coptis chinensis TaxID=261450 RepID=A0A835I1Q9_9MAGN|nr:hypothetical protein IFM89_012323 [Coptis chinensis]
MERFSSVLVGRGWTMFKTKNGSSFVSGNFGSTYPVSVYLYRKVDSSRVEIVDLNCNVLLVRELADDGWVIVDSIIVKELDTSPVLTGSLGMDESSTMSGGEERRGGKLSSDGRDKGSQPP